MVASLLGQQLLHVMDLVFGTGAKVARWSSTLLQYLLSPGNGHDLHLTPRPFLRQLVLQHPIPHLSLLNLRRRNVQFLTHRLVLRLMREKLIAQRLNGLLMLDADLLECGGEELRAL